MLDSDYASDAQTCGTDTDASESMNQRRANAGLGQSAKKVVGPEWRSPDVSEGEDAFLLRNSPNYLVCCLSSMVVVQLFQETGYGHGT
jgi:hypothetical protein